jgi:hypothetical protein
VEKTPYTRSKIFRFYIKSSQRSIQQGIFFLILWNPGRQSLSFSDRNSAITKKITGTYFSDFNFETGMNPEELIFISTVTCPHCGQAEQVLMPRYASKSYYQCPACQQVYQAKKESCCIFCSYGNIACPPAQERSHQQSQVSSHESGRG